MVSVGHRAVFELAREWKSREPAGTRPEAMRPALEALYRRAPEEGRRPLEAVWEDFRSAWGSVQTRPGAGLLEVRRLMELETITVGEGEGLTKVARAFAAASKYHRGGSFYAGYRQIASLAGLSLSHTHRATRALVSAGLLVCVDPGAPGSRGKASTWRWVGQDAREPAEAEVPL